MPRIKGWKKEFERKYGILYRNEVSGNRIYVYKSELFDEWRIRYGKIHKRKEGRVSYYYGGIILKIFQNKKNALKFAINYMKNHPNG